MPERRFKSQVTDVLTEQLPDTAGGALERWISPTTESRVEQIPVEQIHDRAWRGEVDTADPTYRALKASIRASGVLQPLLLRPRADGDGFEVVSGARRLRAARDTAQGTVPAVVRELNDAQALVGGSWDAVLRTGLTAGEGRALVERLVTAGMEEGQAVALVGTAPVREGEDEELAPAAAADVAVAEPPAAAPEVVEEAPVVAEPEAEAAAVVEEQPAVVAEPEAEASVVVEEPAPVAEPEPEAEAPAVVEEPAVVAEPEAEASVVVEEPAVEPEAEAEPTDLDLEGVTGWPTDDTAATATAPSTPPVRVPVDPVVFPVAPLSSENGMAPAEVAEPPAPEAAAPSSEVAEPEVAEPEAAAPEVAAPDVAPEPAAAEAPSAPPEAAAPETLAVAPEVTIPEPARAEPQPEPEPEPEPDQPIVAAPPRAAEPEPAATVTLPEPQPAAAAPRVIPIKLPEPAEALAPMDEAVADGSMPVAAPTPGTVPEAGTRLSAEPVPAVRVPTRIASRPAPTLLPALLRRGPLFYAVLGIGLAVGAIVFILVTVVEGVGSGTAPIIAAVVVAVIGFVTAMVSLAQPRARH